VVNNGGEQLQKKTFTTEAQKLTEPQWSSLARARQPSLSAALGISLRLCVEAFAV
jgi:hypothetical protein